MAFYNDQSNYYVNSNFSLETQHYFNNSVPNFSNHPEESSSSARVRFSTLEPTAPEFQPSSTSTNSNNGAIKKKPNQYNRQRDYGRNKNVRYGSGRTFNGQRSDYNNKYSNKSNEEHSKILEETTSFLRSLNTSQNENSGKKSKPLSELENYHDAIPESHMKSENSGDQPTGYSFAEIQKSYESPTRSIKGNTRIDKNNDKSFRNSFKSDRSTYNNYDNKSRRGNYYDERYGNRNNAYYENHGRNNYSDNRNNRYSYRGNSSGNYAIEKTSSSSSFSDARAHHYDTKESGHGSFKPGFRVYNSKNGDKYEQRNLRDWREKDKITKFNRKCKYFKYWIYIIFFK